jgi:hypothetical protein
VPVRQSDEQAAISGALHSVRQVESHGALRRHRAGCKFSMGITVVAWHPFAVTLAQSVTFRTHSLSQGRIVCDYPAPMPIDKSGTIRADPVIGASGERRSQRATLCRAMCG